MSQRPQCVYMVQATHLRKSWYWKRSLKNKELGQ
jgi:hypothetical protein